jgi:carbon storage regulator
MLVLSRKLNERIVIGPLENGELIVVTMIKIKGNGRAMLGVDAPKNIAVHREEIYERVSDENTR